MKRITVVLLGLLSGCGEPPCTAPLTLSGEAACLKADAGQPRAGEPFLLGVIAGFGGRGTVGPSCDVQVDGGSISATIPGLACLGNQSLPIASVSTVDCTVPALAQGTYTLGGTTFTLHDAGVENLPDCI